jgi:hypothetical protein
LTCGTVKVPLDYRHPRGTAISVAVSRLPTAKRGKRHGDLLLNPGGPALPGLDMPSTMAPTLPASVTDRYDLIGFDPRGVEHSTAQSCGLADPTVSGLFPYPAADGSITANVDLADGATTDADAAVLQQVFADAPATPGVPADNQATMFLALTCGDAAWSNEVSDYATRTAASRASWPLTAGMPDDIWACAFWHAPIESPVKVGNHGPRNTLILQNRRDNATPWDGGVGLHHVLGNRSALVGVDNGGHYVYHAGSACADKATVDFLTTGHLPKKDVDCTDV